MTQQGYICNITAERNDNYKIPTSMETYNDMGIIVEYRVIRVNKARAATYRSNKENKNQEKAKKKYKTKKSITVAPIYYHKSVARVKLR